MIADEMNSLNKTLGEDITEDVARQELVARGCELMLTDANSIKELAKRDKGLFGKIKAKIDEWVKNIIKACNSIINKDGSVKSGTVSKEAMLLKDFALQMRTMWNEALKEAGESNSRIVSKNVDVLDMVRYDANNKPYVEIDEDILDGVAEEDYEQTAKNVLTELFKEGIDYKNNVFTMNKRDKNEFVRNRTMTYWLHNNKKLRMDKLRLSKNAMEIIKNADNWKNVKKKYNNTNNEKIVDFAHGYVNVSVFGNDYSAKVVTGVDKRGIIHLYDISDMMPTEIKRSANTTVHPKRGASIFNGASIDESINEDRKNVNKNILYSYAGEIEARDTSNRMNLPEKERREKIPEKGNENTVHRFFSLRQSVEETKDLIAVHNLSEKNLLENIKLGGFPMPSIAITKANNSYDNFGDILVVFKKDTINPSMEENKVYSGDAWTPMFPRTEWKLNEKAMKKNGRYV